MSVDPREIAKQKFEAIIKEQKHGDETADKIIWTAVSVNAGMGFIPLGINVWSFIGVSTIMTVFLGKTYGLTLTNEGASKMIKQIFTAVGSTFFMTTLGLKFFVEVLKGVGVITMGGTTLIGGALDAALCGGITYALGYTTKAMFKRERTMSNSEIKSIFKQNYAEGKRKVKQEKEEAAKKETTLEE